MCGTIGVSTGGEVSELLMPIATAFATAGQIYITQLVGAGRKGQTKETVSTLLTLIFVIPFGCPGVMLFGYRQIWQF